MWDLGYRETELWIFMLFISCILLTTFRPMPSFLIGTVFAMAVYANITPSVVLVVQP